MRDYVFVFPSLRTAVLVILTAGLLSATLMLAISGNSGPSGLNPALILLPVLLLSFFFGPLIGSLAALGAALSVPVVPGISVDGPAPAPRDAWALDISLYVAAGTLTGALSAHLRHSLCSRLREEHQARREAQRRLQAAPDIIQQERLRALNQMASGVVHDISNTLVPIAAFSELLLYTPELLDDRPRALSYIGAMNKAADDARRILLRLRTFYRPYEVKPVSGPVDLNSLVEDVLSLTEPRWKAEARARGIVIEAAMDLQPIPHASCTDADVREVLMNVIFNAVDAMPQGGVLRLSTSFRNSVCILTVEDTGTGMDPEVLRRATEPFFTTKGERGTGMGLAIAAGIIEAHGGRLEIDSKVGRGTRVSVLLPPHLEDQGAEHAQDLASALNRPLRILVVDDSPSSQQVLTEYLTMDGHTVETVSEGCKGLEKALAGQFDVAIVDAALPKLSGLDLAEAIHRERPACKVIVLSGMFAGVSDAQRPERLQDTPFLLLTKPCTHAELRKALADSMLGPA